ncbi:unnamed protein product [Diabrotica balteata]|uniref:Uncharacterized protein n=1 Tax=Diabrotica balteata TaxID=107213 RepID=A0A9N9SZ27_DIABA|nr:unnamed protein product [Diabrotica balteata]
MLEAIGNEVQNVQQTDTNPSSLGNFIDIGSFENLMPDDSVDNSTSRSDNIIPDDGSDKSTSRFKNLRPDNDQEMFQQSTSQNRSSRKNYTISPVNTDESDVDCSDIDPDYIYESSPMQDTSNALDTTVRSSSPSSSPSLSEKENITESRHKGKKRCREPSKWKQNKAQTSRNSGKSYVSKKENITLIKNINKVVYVKISQISELSPTSTEIHCILMAL